MLLVLHRTAVMGADKVNWVMVAVGVVLGLGLCVVGIVWLGRTLFRRMDLEERGNWDKPLPEPFPKNKVVAIYKRRKHYHRHHRDFYRRGRRGEKRET